MKEYPDRLIGCAAVNPHNPEAEDLLVKCLDEYGFRGPKFHCGLHPSPPTSDMYRPYWEIALARRLPILCHGKADRGKRVEILDR